MKITTIIPIHKFDDTVSSYLNKSFNSIINQVGEDNIPKIIIVAPQEVLNEIIPKMFAEAHPNVSFVNNEGKTDYQSQVNLAVEHVTTDYFSVLEFDDEYAPNYINVAKKYVETYSNIDVFLSIIIEKTEKNENVKLTNETVWAQQFVGENGEMGYLNINALKQYTDFKLSGALIKKSTFDGLGKYKSNIKLTFMYEFLLRALNNGHKIFVIPKICYVHLVNRVDSLFQTYLKEMPINERKFWFETATKESNFTNDRIIDTSKMQKIIISEE